MQPFQEKPILIIRIRGRNFNLLPEMPIGRPKDATSLLERR
jgi:hypothetical protein